MGIRLVQSLAQWAKGQPPSLVQWLRQRRRGGGELHLGQDVRRWAELASGRDVRAQVGSHPTKPLPTPRPFAPDPLGSHHRRSQVGCDSTIEISWRPSRTPYGASDPSRLAPYPAPEGRSRPGSRRPSREALPYLAPESRSAADLAADLAAGITTSPPTSSAIWSLRDRDSSRSRDSSPGSASSAPPQDPTGLWRALEGDKGAAAAIQARQRSRRDRRQLAAQLAAAERSSQTT